MVTDDIAVNTLVLSSGGQSPKQDGSSSADKNDDSGNGTPTASKAVVDSGRPSGSGDNTERKGKGNGKGKGKNKGKGYRKSNGLGKKKKVGK